MKEPATLCPIKETLTYLSVCDTKCTHNKAKCEELRAKIIEETRHCVDCANQDSEFCEPCIDNTPRERFFWSPKKVEDRIVDVIVTAVNKSNSAIEKLKEQMKLF